MATGCGQTSILVDEWSGTDPRSLWNENLAGGATATRNAGAAVITLPNNQANAAAGYFGTTFYYDLRKSSFSVQITELPDQTQSAETVVAMYPPGGNESLQILVSKGLLSFACKNLSGYQILGSTQVMPPSTPYVRFREDGNNVYAEVSSTGTSGWTTIGTTASSGFSSLQYLTVQLGVSDAGGDPSPGSASFQNVNKGTPVGACCATSTLTDDFTSSTRGAQWANSYGQTSQGGGLLMIPLANGVSGSTFAAYQSAQAYMLTGSSLSVEVPEVANVATHGQAGLFYRPSTGGTIGVIYDGGGLSLQFQPAGSSFAQTACSAVYSAATASWVRLSESGGLLAWDLSGDGLTWTQQCIETIPSGLSTDEGEVSLSGGTYESETNPGTVEFAKVNLPP